MVRRLFPCAGLMLLATGCPAQIDVAAAKPAAKANPVVEVTEADPRVIRDGEDLYPAKTIERRDAAKAPAADGGDGGTVVGRGSGRPDETNGVCRLYAPKLPEPECCVANLGFDAALVQEACGLGLYLGESFQGSCGHYFNRKEGGRAWMRISNVAEESLDAAVKTHYRQPAMQGATPPDDMGIAGVVHSHHQGYNWAFLPGWGGAVRMLSWKDGTCSDAGLKTVVQKLVAAKLPPEGAKRSLVPTAQY